MKNALRIISGILFCLLSLPSATQADDRTDWIEKMQAIVPKGYVCRRAAAPLAIDGKLDEDAWKAAAWTDDFVDIQGDAKPKPRFHTRAKLLWDDNFLYIGAEIQEPHVWATLTNHDSVIFRDPDFEVFIDPAANTQPYYEFEMNALNTTWDLLLNRPYMDSGKPHDDWEIPGSKTAVQIQGTLNQSADTDNGWTVEIAFPWKVLSEHARHAGPPTEGEQWRINFSRVEWQVTTTNGGYAKVPHTPEDNWGWSPQGVVDMHRPEMWGRLQFTTLPSEKEVQVEPISGKAARDVALEIYYSQRVFHATNNRYATNVAALGWDAGRLPAGAGAPVLETTEDGYACSVPFTESGRDHVWRIRQDRLLKLDETMPVESETFVATATEKFGDAGRRAAYFLVDNMPPEDRAAFDQDFLMENLSLAFQARKMFPWATNVSERIFFNDVLPYASLDEPRDPWRPQFFALGSEICRDCKTATEAAQALNRELFKRINVHYNLARKRNNQSPKESIEQSKATCTGLSIILVDACRAVGIPARIVGVPEWANKEGNHTWVEIWDGDWFFTGADEYDKAGLNRGWFVADAANTSRSTNRLNQLFASSWRRTGDYFPMSWNLDSQDVPAVNVSARYATLVPDTNSTHDLVSVRLRDKENGERLSATVEMRGAEGQLLASDHTRSGTADLNDMPGFTLPPNTASLIFRFVRNGEAREKTVPCALCMKSHTLDFAWDELKPVAPEILSVETWLAKPAAERGAPPEINFSRDAAKRMIALAWTDVQQSRATDSTEELSAKKIVIGEHSMKWLERNFGNAPDGKHSLWITMHGGGQGTEEENDLNWKGYYGRYEFPPGSINVAPRAPANTWNMWHVPWVDDLFDRMIADYVLQRGVDPSRVYLIGYSAGGDGVYGLAPRLADRFAAAGMCAGHQNQVTPEGLRNLPFFLYMGGADDAYHRNTVVREFSAKMDALQAADPDGYWHQLTVYPGLPHNMQGREAEMIPRMTSLRRMPWPRRVVWKQSDEAEHTRFYWLSRETADIKPNEIFAAHIDGQTITIETPASGRMTLRLSDELLDLDQPVRVVAGGKTIFEGNVKRSFGVIYQSLHEREDSQSACTAQLPVSW
ncbi:MAG TPA: sugar-binding protein [Verrucomicrobiae bacterium]|jgi:transglutaminase-like putative cysteine protease|nr:sugar-binding protein [Verrucomicrobiae bacterium]